MDASDGKHEPLFVLRPRTSIKIVGGGFVLVGLVSLRITVSSGEIDYGAVASTLLFAWGLFKIWFSSAEVFSDRVVNYTRVLMGNEEVATTLRWDHVENVNGLLGWSASFLGLIFVKGRSLEDGEPDDVVFSCWFTDCDKVLCHVIRKVDRSIIGEEVLEYAESIDCSEQ